MPVRRFGTGIISVSDSLEVIIDMGSSGRKVMRIDDIVTNVGISSIARILIGLQTLPFVYVAVGSGTTSPSTSDTSLENEVARALGTPTTERRRIQNDTSVVTASFTFSSQVTLSESGLFDSPSGGNMLCRAVFRPITVQPDETVWFRWELTFGRV